MRAFFVAILYIFLPTMLFPGQHTVGPTGVDGVLYVILAGQTNSSIAESVKTDIACMKRSLQTIAGGINFGIRLDELTGNRCTAKTISSKLQKLRPSSKDIVVFYYSGHGCNPWLKFAWPTFPGKSSLCGDYVEALVNRLKKRSAIILFDCCNADLSRRKKDCCDTKGASAPFFLERSAGLGGFFRLLRSFRGTVTLCAASTGQKAICSPAIGSYFTRSLLESIWETGAEEGLCWQTVCQLTEEKTKNRSGARWGGGQCPIYKIAEAPPKP